MKKKIKDLTLEEIMKICKNNFCTFCPIKDVLCHCELKIPTIDEIDANTEIEVEE